MRLLAVARCDTRAQQVAVFVPRAEPGVDDEADLYSDDDMEVDVLQLPGRDATSAQQQQQPAGNGAPAQAANFALPAATALEQAAQQEQQQQEQQQQEQETQQQQQRKQAQQGACGCGQAGAGGWAPVEEETDGAYQVCAGPVRLAQAVAQLKPEPVWGFDVANPWKR